MIVLDYEEVKTCILALSLCSSIIGDNTECLELLYKMMKVCKVYEECLCK